VFRAIRFIACWTIDRPSGEDESRAESLSHV
jgi:hypothetical protein